MAYRIIDIRDSLRQTREAKGLTQSGLGERIGQPQSAVSRIERGGDLRLSTLLEIARVLELEPILIPKHLVPAVKALIGHAADQKDSHTTETGSIPLAGGIPEDAENDSK